MFQLISFPVTFRFPPDFFYLYDYSGGSAPFEVLIFVYVQFLLLVKVASSTQGVKRPRVL